MARRLLQRLKAKHASGNLNNCGNIIGINVIQYRVEVLDFGVGEIDEVLVDYELTYFPFRPRQVSSRLESTINLIATRG